MKNHEGDIREFHQLSRAWYAEYNRMEGRIDEVNFGYYSPEGGTSGEMAVVWEVLGSRVVPKLVVYEDAWHALSMFSDVIQRMGEYDSMCITPEVFCAMLRSCGFVDMTKTER